jgi:hypothetical protein
MRCQACRKLQMLQMGCSAGCWKEHGPQQLLLMRRVRLVEPQDADHRVSSARGEKQHARREHALTCSSSG